MIVERGAHRQPGGPAAPRRGHGLHPTADVAGVQPRGRLGHDRGGAGRADASPRWICSLRLRPPASGWISSSPARSARARTPAAWLIAAARVTIDGRPARKNERLRGGEAIAVADEALPAPADAGVWASYGVVWEDAALLIVRTSRPGGRRAPPAAGHRSRDALAGAGAAMEPAGRAGLAAGHRAPSGP